MVSIIYKWLYYVLIIYKWFQYVYYAFNFNEAIVNSGFVTHLIEMSSS